MDYAFRINCKIAGGGFDSAGVHFPLDLPPPAPAMELRFPEKGPQTSFIIWSGGYPSEDAAAAAGAPVKAALQGAGILLGVGIDVGEDRTTSKAFTRRDGTPDPRLQPNIHGLQVVPDIEGLLFGGAVFGRPEVILTPELFNQRFAEAYKAKLTLTPKQALAAQLYSQSHFQATDATILLTLISSIEALSERAKRGAEFQTLLDEFIARVDEAEQSETEEEIKVKKDGRTAFMNGLNELRNEGISAACRRMTRSLLDDNAVADLRRLYSIRSKILHSGRVPDGTDMEKELQVLDALVRNLLIQHIVASRKKG